MMQLDAVTGVQMGCINHWTARCHAQTRPMDHSSERASFSNLASCMREALVASTSSELELVRRDYIQNSPITVV